MASVAKCPQCEHELLIPDGADLAAWAKCPACSAFFQLEEVSLREVAKPILVDSDFAPLPSNEVDAEEELSADDRAERDWPQHNSPAAAKTLADFASPVEDDAATIASSHAEETAPVDDGLHPVDRWFKHQRAKPRLADVKDLGATDEASDAQAAEVPSSGEPHEEPGLTESAEAAAQRIEKWFHSAETLPDVRPVVSEDPAEAGMRPLTGEIPRDPELQQMLTNHADAASDNPSIAEAVEAAEQEHYDLDEEKIDSAARTLAEFSPPQPMGRGGATVEFSADALAAADDDFELDSLAGRPQNTSTWDDSEHMERLLADADPEAFDAVPPVVHQSVTPTQAAVGDDPAAWMTAHPPRAPRRRSVVRTLVTTVVGGLCGLAIGYYVWLLAIGSRGDFLEIAHYIPSQVLPASFGVAPIQITGNTTGLPPAEIDSSNDATTAMPARFEAEVKPSNKPRTKDDDRYATAPVTTPTEPSQFQEPVAVSPLTGASESPSAHAVANAPSYSADELAVSLRAAQGAQPDLVAGELSDGKAVQQAKGKSYSTLCDLAEKVTFVDIATRADYVVPLARDAEKLFRETLANAHTRGEVARIAPVWIGSPNRRTGGVFFAGSLSEPTGRGPVTESQVDLGNGAPITVLLSDEMATRIDAAGKPMGVVGSIIENPAQRVTGYTGSAKQAVWVSSLIPLE